MGQPSLEVAEGSSIGVERNGDNLAPTLSFPLQPNDIVRVSGTNAATVSYVPENSRIEVQPGSVLMVRDWTKGKQFELRVGGLHANVARQRPFRSMVVRTPQAEARVLGTEFTLTVSSNTTRLDVTDGRVGFKGTNSAATIKVRTGEYAIAGEGVELNALPQTGSLLREVWTGIPGDDVNDLLYHANYPNRPSGRDFVNAFEVTEIQTNNLGCRLIGYVHPPVTGEYTFWIAASEEAVLWFSMDEDPANKVRIASAPGGEPRDWDARPPAGGATMPKSPRVALVAGQRYLIQAVLKTAGRPGHLSVAWQRPGGQRELLSGEFLSPFEP
jgi:hypothetical protein